VKKAKQIIVHFEDIDKKDEQKGTINFGTFHQKKATIKIKVLMEKFVQHINPIWSRDAIFCCGVVW
jgi:hypothetical protein